MKDEEMAEEYLQSIEGDDCVIITDREERKQTFLAGLKAGRQIEQLAQAKELLKEAKGYIENIDDEGDKLYDKIEQFLKE